MRFLRLVKSIILCLLLIFGHASSQRRSNIPEIDSLPVEDWHVETPSLSYTRALLYSVFIPGGGGKYTASAM